MAESCASGREQVIETTVPLETDTDTAAAELRAHLEDVVLDAPSAQ